MESIIEDKFINYLLKGNIVDDSKILNKIIEKIGDKNTQLKFVKIMLTSAIVIINNLNIDNNEKNGIINSLRTNLQNINKINVNTVGGKNIGKMMSSTKSNGINLNKNGKVMSPKRSNGINMNKVGGKNIGKIISPKKNR